MSPRDPWQSSEFKAFAARWGRDVYPMLARSGVSITIQGSSPSEVDIQQALEIGMTLLLDKPLIVICPAGRTVPDQLRRVASAVIEGDLKDPAFQDRLAEVIKTVAEGLDD